MLQKTQRDFWMWLAGLALFTVGCDPVLAAKTDALGGEVDGVPEGPTHRPGNPCTYCHSGGLAAPPRFAVAGTVYTTREATAPATGAIVTIVDATGQKRTFTANAVGNFYPGSTAGTDGEVEDISLSFPLKVSVSYRGVTNEMKTLVNGEASCAACHSKAGPVPPVFAEPRGGR